jgi:hypothetical protein
MMLLQKIVARVRGTNDGNYPENREEEELQVSSYGDLIVSQSLPSKAELVRLGESWQVMGAASTGLTAVPTTAGLLTLWNGEPGNGKVYAIDTVACFRPIIDVTTIDMFTVFAQIIRMPMAAPTDAALSIRSLSGRYTYGGRARTVATSTTLANRWDTLGTSAPKASALGGTAWECLEFDLLGRYIITPGSAFTLSAAEITATASALRFTIRWHELQIPYVG